MTHACDACPFSFPLRRAAAEGHLKAVEVLLEGGADPRAQLDGAIRAAAEGRHLPVVQHLLRSNVELQQKARRAVVSFLANQSSEVLEDMLYKAKQRCRHRVVRLLKEASGQR